MANARWELVGQGQGVRTVAEATQDGDAVRLVVGSETTTFSGSLEEAVRQTPQLRALAPDMEWSLTTNLKTGPPSPSWVVRWSKLISSRSMAESGKRPQTTIAPFY